jgi:uncharacterized membrane protein SirB2
MFYPLLKGHMISAAVFILIYLIKTILLLANKHNQLKKFTKIVKVPEMIVSAAFLVTGIYLWAQSSQTGLWLYVKTALVLATIPIAIIAFKKSNKVLAVLSFVLLLVVYRFGETRSISFKKAKPEMQVYPATDPTEDAKMIYASKCSSCHGMQGEMQLSGASLLSASALSMEERIQIIHDGKKTMASYKEQLTEEQIKAVAAYTMSLKK